MLIEERTSTCEPFLSHFHSNTIYRSFSAVAGRPKTCGKKIYMRKGPSILLICFELMVSDVPYHNLHNSLHTATFIHRLKHII